MRTVKRNGGLSLVSQFCRYPPPEYPVFTGGPSEVIVIQWVRPRPDWPRSVNGLFQLFTKRPSCP